MRLNEETGMDNNRRSLTASITVFFALLILPLMALVLVVLKAVSSHIEQNDCIRMTMTAGNALLSCYDSKLAHRYGLYGADQELLERYAGAFVRENERIPTEEIRQTPAYLVSSDPLWTGFFRYAVGKVSLQTEKTLSDPDVLSAQIREFMKYRLIAEGYDALLKACSTIKEVSAGTGIEGQFSKLQDKLTEYGQKYQELLICLYPDGGMRYYVTLTQKDKYAPIKLKEAVQALHGKKKEESMPKEVHTLQRWNTAAEKLAEINRKACGILEEMEEMLADIRKAAQELKTEAAKLSAEEQDNARIRDILKQTEEIESNLWGANGELAEYRRICTDNANVTGRITEYIPQVLHAVKYQKEASEQAWQDALSAADAFAETYRDDYVLPETGSGGISIRNLGRIWDWILDWRVDLKKYGPDKNIIPDQEAEEVYLSEKESLMEAVDELGRESTLWESSFEKFAIVEYCVGMFRNLEDQVLQEEGKTALNLRREPFSDGLLKNETEFILKGSFNEYRNLKAVRFRILAIRLIMNMAFLRTDTERNTKILQIAAQTGGMIAPGVGTKITYDAILTLWAAAEAYVDYNILVQGGRIALIKSGDEWFTDLDAILTMNKKNLLEKTKESSGLDYEDYLRILLLFGDRDKELFRIRELIERNLQKSGDTDFSLSDCAVSFVLETEIKAKNGTYTAGEVFSYE